MNGKYEIGDYVLNNWKLVKKLGTGSFGTVFEAHRNDFGEVMKAAIKIVTIPQSQTEVNNAQSQGMTEAEITESYKGVVKELVNECTLMSKVKGVANIVGYEDHEVIAHQGIIGWDILIRMELVTPLTEYVKTHSMTPKETAKLGVDICQALEACEKIGIIHRDIKPANIMISDFGDYKLGDFGISKMLEKTQGGLSKKGTSNYMAPEVAKGEKYGLAVDIYSLGIVLYQFLNDNRLPLLPEAPATINFQDMENAVARRIAGAALPMPKNADKGLGKIVLKACAYRPEDRYASPKEFRADLEKWLQGKYDEIDVVSKPEEIPVWDPPAPWKGKTPKASSKWKKYCLVAVVIGVLAIGFGMLWNGKNQKDLFATEQGQADEREESDSKKKSKDSEENSLEEDTVVASNNVEIVESSVAEFVKPNQGQTESIVTPPAPTSLQNLTAYAPGAYALEDSYYRKDLEGNQYQYTLYSTHGRPATRTIGRVYPEAYNVYYLDGKYEAFTATVTVFDKGKATGYIEIYGDDQVLWETYDITQGMRSYDIAIDVKDVKCLKIVIMDNNAYEYLTFGLGDPTLYADSQQVENILERPEKQEITELKYMTAYDNGTSKLNDEVVICDNFYVYRYALYSSSYSDGKKSAYNAYFINGEYRKFTAYVTTFNNKPATGYIEIYGDDKLLWSDYNITKGIIPYTIDVDVTGVKVLKIVIMQNSYYDALEVGLGEPILIK